MKPLEEPPEWEGDDSINKPDGTLVVTTVDLTATEDLDEDDFDDA